MEPQKAAERRAAGGAGPAIANDDTQTGGVRAADTTSSPAKAEVIKLISNPATVSILSALMGAESYPRELALRLGMRETHVSERLRALEGLGLVKGKWKRIETGPGGRPRNAKVYASVATSMNVALDASGLQLELKSEGGSAAYRLAQPLYAVRIPRASLFVGRAAELRELARSRAGLTVVTGIAGIGKTTLASKFARAAAGRGRRAVFWHDIRESDSLRYVLAKVAAFLDSRGRTGLSRMVARGVTDESSLAEMAVRELDRTYAAVIFDDYHFCRDAGITHLLQRLADADRVKTVVVSRTRPVELYAKGKVAELSLAGHTDREAAELLRSSGTPLSKGDVARINGRLKGHPLALKLMSTAIKTGGMKGAFERALSGAARYLASWLESSLDPGELETLERASVFRESVPFDAIREASEGGVTSEAVLAHRTASLERLGVVTRSGENFVVHDLVREAALSLSPSSAGAHNRAARWYAAKGDGWSLIEAIYHFVNGGSSDEAVRLVSRSVDRIVDEGHVEPFLHMIEGLLTTSQAPMKSDRRLNGHLLAQKAYCVWRMGGRYDSILRLTRKAELLGRDSGDDTLVATALASRSYVLAAMGDVDAAMKACRKGLETTDVERSDPASAAGLMISLTDQMTTKGMFAKAIPTQVAAIELFRKAGDRRMEGSAAVGLGVYYYMKGDFDKALSSLREARPLVEPSNMILTEFLEAASGLALERLPGKRREALKHLNRAIGMAKQSMSKVILLEVMSERVILRAKLGETRRARLELEGALRLKAGTERKYSLGLLELAQAALDLSDGEPDGCERHLKAAGRLLAFDAVSAGRVLWWRALAEASRGRLAGSRVLFAKARRAFEKVGADGHAERVGSVMAEVTTSRHRTGRDAVALGW
ncbi:MAG: AAA family ATPase [Nitrososphaerota archaeon]|nr:AAA family ATPase [Nitrososphaerota archaeon]